MHDHDDTAVSGPGALEALADIAAGQGEMAHCAHYRRLAREWRNDRTQLAQEARTRARLQQQLDRTRTALAG